jgi:hypothetical protein
MPPRFAYWTILIDNRPTAFRAREREELLPTLAQLRRTNPDVALKYFARGRLWESREQASWAREHLPKKGEGRGKDWRPGGAHRDPRARFDKPHRRKKHAPHADRRHPPAGGTATARPDRGGPRTSAPRPGGTRKGQRRGPRSGPSPAPHPGQPAARSPERERHRERERRGGKPLAKKPVKPARAAPSVAAPKDPRRRGPDAPPAPGRVVDKPDPPVRG